MSNHNLFIHGADGAAAPATAEQILAAARQVLAPRVRRGATLTSPQKVREYLSMRLGHLDYEVFGFILVDSHHRVIGYVELFRGTIDGASVHPREVVKLVLVKQAAACLLVHNHPSQVGEFSHADELITRRLKEVLQGIDVRILDHVLGGGWHRRQHGRAGATLAQTPRGAASWRRVAFPSPAGLSYFSVE